MQDQSFKASRPGRRAVLQSLLCGAAVGVSGMPGLAFAAEAEGEIDFSYAGYGAGMATPSVAAVARLNPSGVDDTLAINHALDAVASRDPDARGLRGAVLLSPGRFHVDGALRVPSGVVLRGAPRGATTVYAAGEGRRTLIEIGGPEPKTAGAARAVVAAVPAGALVLPLADVAGLAVGDRVAVRRPSTADWIAALGMNTATGNFVADRLHWKPGTRDLVWNRTIVAMDANRGEITLDAPITYALEPRFGGGSVIPTGAAAANIGLEDLVLESAFDASRPMDEEHSWIAVALDHVEDAWVRNVTTRHFVSSAVRVGHGARRVTVENVACLEPVSEIGGCRRQSFVVEGQQVLVVDCRAEQGLNDFSTGMLAAGPNVFLRCTAQKALGDSGGFESFSAGVLFDQVRIEGAGLVLRNDPGRVQGAGWTNANCVLWRSMADRIVAEGPLGVANAQAQGAGSLYERQRQGRLGSPRPTPSPAVGGRVEPVAPIADYGAPLVRPSLPVTLAGGRFVSDGRVVWGGALNHGWWRGQTYPAAALDHGRSFSRFVPGRVGRGLIEDIDVLADDMVAAKTPFFQSGPGLWYDRRRDDHLQHQRPDGNVWAPFYEMPWARSGQGTAFHGLSKYDLTKFNPWYFQRLREFTQACDARGLVHFHNLYNTHNILETAAHYVDYPWRPFNNINDTGLPEPIPLDRGNTVHLAHQLYRMDYPPLAELHRAYMNRVLDEIGGAQNVILGVAFQFAGPLAFQQAFLDVVADWEKKNGKKVRIALTTSKDITDAILEDSVRGKQVEVIDQRYWQYRPDGTLWAPRGDRNLAFREMITQDFGRSGDAPPDTTPEQAYRQVREYRERYPDKAVVAWHNGVTAMPALMAGAAQVLNRNPSAGHGQGRVIDRTPVDAFVQEHLADRLAAMSPANDLVAAGKGWALADAERRTILIYAYEGPTVTLAPVLAGRSGQWFSPRDGRTVALAEAGPVLTKPDSAAWALLLR